LPHGRGTARNRTRSQEVLRPVASERLLLLVVALGGVAASATVAGATHVRAKEQGEPTLAFDCAPPHPGPPRSLGDTLCVGTADWRRRFRTLAAMRSSGTAVFPSWSPDGQRLLFRIALSRGNSSSTISG
jgi:hypothetical protein